VIALLTLCPGASVEKNAAVQVRIERAKHFIAKRSVLRLKPLFPTPFELISVLIDKPVQHGLFRAPTGAANELFLRVIPCSSSFHIGGIEK